MSAAVLFDSSHIDRSPSRLFALGLFKPPPEHDKPARPVYRPEPTDSAWWLGYDLGLHGEIACPPSRWTHAEKEAFTQGNRDGREQLYDEMDSAFPTQFGLDLCSCGCGRPLGWTLEDFNEARLTPPPCSFLDRD